MSTIYGGPEVQSFMIFFFIIENIFRNFKFSKLFSETRLLLFYDFIFCLLKCCFRFYHIIFFLKFCTNFSPPGNYREHTKNHIYLLQQINSTTVNSVQFVLYKLSTKNVCVCEPSRVALLPFSCRFSGVVLCYMAVSHLHILLPLTLKDNICLCVFMAGYW